MRITVQMAMAPPIQAAMTTSEMMVFWVILAFLAAAADWEASSAGVTTVWVTIKLVALGLELVGLGVAMLSVGVTAEGAAAVVEGASEVGAADVEGATDVVLGVVEVEAIVDDVLKRLVKLSSSPPLVVLATVDDGSEEVETWLEVGLFVEAAAVDEALLVGEPVALADGPGAELLAVF